MKRTYTALAAALALLPCPRLYAQDKPLQLHGPQLNLDVRVPADVLGRVDRVAGSVESFGTKIDSTRLLVEQLGGQFFWLGVAALAVVLFVNLIGRKG